MIIVGTQLWGPFICSCSRFNLQDADERDVGLQRVVKVQPGFKQVSNLAAVLGTHALARVCSALV